MKITKSWLYKLSEITDDIIEIEDNIALSIIDDKNVSCIISLWQNSHLDFFWYIDSINQSKTNSIHVKQSKSGSKLHFRYLIKSNSDIEIKTKIFSEIKADNCKSDVKILSIAWNNWDIDLDWIIKIHSKIKWVKARLEEENIFLWNSWKVKWIPTLLVESNDVEASHACKIERISDEKLFYLRSRWIWKENAISMMIDAKIFDLFKCLNMISTAEFEYIKNKF